MWIYRRRGGERKGAEVSKGMGDSKGVGDGRGGNGWIRKRRGKTGMVGV